MRYLFLLVFFASAQLSAQSWYVRNHIDWLTGPESVEQNSLNCLNFRNEILPVEDNTPGSFFNRLEWNDRPEELSLEILSFESEFIDFSFEENGWAGDDFSLEFSTGNESGKTFLQYSLFPFRFNPSAGKIERITSFILKITAIETSLSSSPKKAARKNLSPSPLASGKWFKIRTGESGIYKLTYNELLSIGIENPGNTRIYGWGGIQLSHDVNDSTQDELLPVQCFFNKGDDGIFNSGDYLLFYASGPVSWKFDPSKEMYFHSKNNYSDHGYYFLTSGAGPAVEPADMEVPSGEPDYISSTGDFLAFHETDDFNPILSGREWYGELFDLSVTRDFVFQIPGIQTNEDVILQSLLFSRAKEEASFYIYANNLVLDTAYIRQTNLSDYSATYAYSSKETYKFRINNENLTVKLRYNKPDPTASGMLDYLAVNARQKLKLYTSQFSFRDYKSLTKGTIAAFNLENTNQDTRIWMVDDIHQIRNVPFSLNAGIASFKVSSTGVHEFVAFNIKGNFPTPEFTGNGLGKIENQDLHSVGNPELIIITSPEFLSEAERLAEFRRQNNGLEVYITFPEKIYNDFSGGRPDISAIRNFIKEIYNKSEGNPELKPKYLLLFGDGSFKFKNAGPAEGNFVPTYQSENSISPVFSYVSDDFFGLLDPGEEMYAGLLDIGIGRLPVKNLAESRRMVDKIINYESSENMGDWRNTICFIGDDEDYNIHSQQADELARYVEAHYISFNTKKIFLDAYRQETTSKGERYPDVNLAINEQISKGALILNYTGHGGTKGLAHEQILGLNDISSWENKSKLPLFMTATCEFSRYDEPEIVSAGEEVILNPGGGGIALLTTTRLVYSGPNHVLNERFYEIVFEKDSEGKNYCLGDIMKYSKNMAGFGINKRNFTLLGDPAMRLSYPSKSIVTDSINYMPITWFSDTLKAFEKLTISGHIEDEQGIMDTDFNGILLPSVFDKAVKQTTLANDGGSPQIFKTRKNLLYKGNASIKDGYFSFSFIIPKDINYAVGEGRISYYAFDSTTDATGAYNKLMIGGSAENYDEDMAGPEIEVYMNNHYFMEGGMTSENPVLYTVIRDEHGINTTGNGIGHDITATLNSSIQSSYVLNDFYQSALDSYQSGVIEYPFFNLEEGKYEVKVKVWDIYNNASEASTTFIVVKDRSLILDNLLNFPNPFNDYTEISFEHNKSGTDLDIWLDIFNLNGELVKSLRTKQYNSGFRSEPLIWDGKTENGSPERQGVYLYRIRVKTSDGKEAENSGRMIIMR